MIISSMLMRGATGASTVGEAQTFFPGKVSCTETEIEGDASGVSISENNNNNHNNNDSRTMCTNFCIARLIFL